MWIPGAEDSTQGKTQYEVEIRLECSRSSIDAGEAGVE